MELDSHEVYELYDPEDVGHGIENLPEQIRIAWHDTREIEVPRNYADVSNIVVAAMGGSALGPYMLKCAFGDRLSVPFEVVRDYTLPEYVNRNTLVILSSFSGSTEEVLAAAEQAKAAKAKIIAISAGGKLAEMAKAEGWPLYEFDPGDLAKQPRYGTGFSLVGVMGLLERAGLLKLKDTELQKLISGMSEVIDNCAMDVPGEENPAKLVAHELQGKTVIVVAGAHLMGNANTFNNQVNETAKQFSFYMPLPELNHHFLEGLKYPAGENERAIVFLLRSSLYHPRVQKRCDVTAEIFEQKGISVIEYVCKGESPLEEVGEALQFGSYVGLYLAMLNKVVTTDIETTIGVKKKMAE